MYEITETTTHITEKSGGVEYQFRLFNVYDRMDVIARLKKQKRDLLIFDLGDSEIDKEQRFAELSNFNATWNDQQAFNRYVESAVADVELAALALGEPDTDKAKKIVAGLRPQFGWLAFKAALFGLEIIQRPSGESPIPGAAPNPANPQKPPGPGTAYGT